MYQDSYREELRKLTKEELIERVLKEGQDFDDLQKDSWFLYFVQVPCSKCLGIGRHYYPNTATWNSKPGVIAGQAFTVGTCDKCWGTGEEHKQGLNLRKLSETKFCEACEQKLKEVRNHG